MSLRLAIVDYEMGNLRSVQKALENVGAKAEVTSSAAALRKADAIVLPGVGAFGEASKRLKRLGLFRPIQEALKAQAPFLGICLGMQLLFESSEESRGAEGLGFLKGTVRRFSGPAYKTLKIPHMGWNGLQIRKKNKTPSWKSLKTGDYFYFVHSYFAEPALPRVIAADAFYGKNFCAVVAGSHYVASQFHPEKSGDNGLQFLRNFITKVAAA